MAESVGDVAGAGTHLAPEAVGAGKAGDAAAARADPASGDRRRWRRHDKRK
jgi:hypothetical protein